jgi:hypothetical protein
VASYRVDAALVHEMLDLLRRAAVLVGDWGTPPRASESPPARPAATLTAPHGPELLDLTELGDRLGVPFEPLPPQAAGEGDVSAGRPTREACRPRSDSAAPPTFERAALLVALDELGEREVARRCGIPRSTLVGLKRRPEFRERVREHRAAWQSRRPRLRLASRVVRLRELDRLLERLRRIDEARGALPPVRAIGTVPWSPTRPLLTPEPALGYWGPYDSAIKFCDLLPARLRLEILDHAAGQVGDDRLPRTAERLPRRARRVAAEPSGLPIARERRRSPRRRPASGHRAPDGPSSATGSTGWSTSGPRAPDGPSDPRWVAPHEPLRPAV